MVGFLVNSRVATYWELKNIYSLEDAYMMHEAVYVPLENKNIATERAINKSKHG